MYISNICVYSYIMYMYIHIYVLCVYVYTYVCHKIKSENIDYAILMFLQIKDAFDNIRYICICLQIPLCLVFSDVKFHSKNRIE